MRVLIILGSSAFFFALVLTPLVRNLLRRRSDQPVPSMGGIPIGLAYMASFAALLVSAQQPPTGPIHFHDALRLAPALLLVLFLGILDDRFRLQPAQKLIVQICAAGWAYWTGVRIVGFVGHHIPDWLSLAATISWLLLCTNAFNLIDGVDGLAAGVGLFATTTTLIAALLQQNWALAIATVPLCGALFGFLRYNFNPATIFLGRSGSLPLGFLLGCFGVIWSQKSATMLGMTAPLMALSIPILDISLSVVRRFLRRQPILRADRDHIHHRLLDRGLSPRRVVLLLYGICGLAAVFSLFQSVAVNRFSAAIVVLFCGVAWVGIQNLGYAEFDQARRMVLGGGFRQALNGQLALRKFDRALTEARTTEQRWAVLRQALDDFGMVEVVWQNDGKVYREQLWQVNGNATWSLRIPLAGDDHVDFTRIASSDDRAINAGALVQVVRRSLMSPLAPVPEPVLPPPLAIR